MRPNESKDTFRVVQVRNCSCMGDHKEHVIREGTLIKYEDGTYGRNS